MFIYQSKSSVNWLVTTQVPASDSTSISRHSMSTKNHFNIQIHFWTWEKGIASYISFYLIKRFQMPAYKHQISHLLNSPVRDEIVPSENLKTTVKWNCTTFLCTWLSNSFVLVFNYREDISGKRTMQSFYSDVVRLQVSFHLWQPPTIFLFFQHSCFFFSECFVSGSKGKVYAL